MIRKNGSKRKRVRYTDEPMEVGERMPDDFLPSPQWFKSRIDHAGYGKRVLRNLRPEFLTKNGRREFVVLTVEQYETLTHALTAQALPSPAARSSRRNRKSRSRP